MKAVVLRIPAVFLRRTKLTDSLNSIFDVETVAQIEQRVYDYIGQSVDVGRIVLSNPEATFEEDVTLNDTLTEISKIFFQKVVIGIQLVSVLVCSRIRWCN